MKCEKGLISSLQRLAILGIRTFGIGLLFVTICFAAKPEEVDDRVIYDNWPHFTITPHANLNGFGYQPFSTSISSGINYEGKHFMFDGQASYSAARKTNDGTENNNKGHSRGVTVVSMARLPKDWLAGVRFSGGQTSTTNYTKSVWRGSFGAGKDVLLNDVSFRITAFYTLPYSDHSNGLQGPLFGFVLPSPITKHHFYFTEELGIGFLHATITDPNNKELTRIQLNDRSHSASVSFGVMFKF